jgi:hypothetical protein
VGVNGAGGQAEATENQQRQSAAQKEGSHGKGFLGNGKNKPRMFLLNVSLKSIV